MEIAEFLCHLILREINFGQFISSETVDFDSELCKFYKFQHSKSAKIHKKSKFRAFECVKMVDFASLESDLT